MRKFNWPLVLCIAFCVGFWLAFGVAVSHAAYQDQRLNAVASAVAGHPVTVSCAASAHEWSQFEDAAGYTFETDGFTYIGRTPSVIYLAPRICDTLVADEHAGPTAVGDFWNGLAIKVILHEASHQAGISDEGAADCNALSLVKQYAPSFGYSKTVTSVSYRKLANGTYKRVVRTVPNPALARLYSWASFWHRALPANYQGTC